MAAASQMGQKEMPLTPTSAPIPHSSTVAGMSREKKASDSPNASRKTIGIAHSSCSCTKAITDLANSGISTRAGSWLVRIEGGVAKAPS